MITFNGISAPSYFKVIEYNDSLTPGISQTTQAVAGRAGVIDFGNELDARTIEIKYMIKATDEADLRIKARVIANWLLQKEAKPLIYDFEPDKYYNAKLTGETEVEEILNLGQGTLTFFCSDPYAYSTSTKIANILDGETTINNNGTVEVEPIIDLTFGLDATEVSITANDEFLIFGEPKEVGKTVVNKRPNILSDNFDSYTGWSTAGAIHDGVITGTMGVGSSHLKATSYGEGTGWHGPAVVKNFSRAVTNFEFDTNAYLQGTAVGQLGRIQIFFRSGQEIVAMISLRNGNPDGLTPYAEIKMGATGSHKLLETYGAYKGVWKNYLNGLMNVSRINNKWTFEYGIYDSKKKAYHTRKNVYYTDTKKLYAKPIDSVVIHFGAHGTAPVLPKLSLGGINVYERITTATTSTQVANTFKVGDNLVINNATGEVTLNGKAYYTTMNPSSKFIQLEQGANNLIIEPALAVTGTVEFTERWK